MRNIFQPIITPYFKNIILQEQVLASLDPVEIPDGAEFTPVARTVREGRTLRIQYEPYLEGLPDTDFPAFTQWSQLNLTSATAVLEYLQASVTTPEFADIGQSDLRFGQDRWQGEANADSDIDVVGFNATLRALYFRTSDNVFRLYRIVAPRQWVTPGPNHYDVLSVPNTWLGSRSTAEILTYFESNTFSSSITYYVYHEDSGEVQRITALNETDTWVTLMDTVEYDEVSNDELTLDASQLRSRGILDITLIDPSIPMDVMNKFRVDITLNQG